jgi:ABC-2 type transport system ATP-binding protein
MISVEGVTKRFGDLVAVRNLDFEVGKGEVVGFLGPNGAGKTTTMRMLTGTLEPDEGRVLYDQVPISQDLTAAKKRLGYLPETNPLYDEMLVSEYLEYAAQLRLLSQAEAQLKPAAAKIQALNLATQEAIKAAVGGGGEIKTVRDSLRFSKKLYTIIFEQARLLHREAQAVLDTWPETPHN